MIDPCLVDRFHREVLRKPTPAKPLLLESNPERAEKLALQLNEMASECRSHLDDPLLLRVAFSLEELAEWVEAHSRKKCLVAAIDGIADRIFLAIGDAVEQGLCEQLSAAYRAVCDSNLSKTGCTETGKAIKGPGYFSPTARLEEILGRKAVE